MGTAHRVRASCGHRFPITVRPTKVDIAVAREIARDTAPAPEEVARALTWGADEKVRLVLAAAGWLAAGALPTGPQRAIRAFAIGLSLTRVVVLAHWASDVVAGFALGAMLERLLRLWTGYSLDSPKEDARADS
jgi:hypothetical protein